MATIKRFGWSLNFSFDTEPFMEKLSPNILAVVSFWHDLNLWKKTFSEMSHWGALHILNYCFHKRRHSWPEKDAHDQAPWSHFYHQLCKKRRWADDFATTLTLKDKYRKGKVNILIYINIMKHFKVKFQSWIVIWNLKQKNLIYQHCMIWKTD